MAQMDNQVMTGGSSPSDTLNRLSQKPGVIATIVLDSNTGSLLGTKGHVSSLHANIPQGTTAAPNSVSDIGQEESTPAQAEAQGVEQLASMVWKFVEAAGGLVTGLDNEDEVKLLRLRTKKHELVIVPDTKYILVVIHETPPA